MEVGKYNFFYSLKPLNDLKDVSVNKKMTPKKISGPSGVFPETSQGAHSNPGSEGSTKFFTGPAKGKRGSTKTKPPRQAGRFFSEKSELIQLM